MKQHSHFKEEVFNSSTESTSYKAQTGDISVAICLLLSEKFAQMVKGTDYDSLYPGHFLLREKVLLQPFKIIVGPVHMVHPGPRQLAQTRGNMRL